MKYLFVPIWGGGFIAAIIASVISGDQFSLDWAKYVALLVGWAMFWISLLVFRLRRVEASKDKIIIKTFRGKKEIEYKDIVWVYQIAMMSPALISLKYSDNRTGEIKRILIMPDTISDKFPFNFMAESKMTIFIREKIMENNPDYSKEAEPSRWLVPGMVFLSLIPVLLYFYINMESLFY